MSTTKPRDPFASSVNVAERQSTIHRLTVQEMADAFDATPCLMATTARQICARLNGIRRGWPDHPELELINHTITRYKERFNL